MGENDNNVLKQILDRASYKFETSFQINMNESSHKVNLLERLNLNNELSYKVALVLFSTFNMPEIINSTNNQLRYSKDSGTTWKTISINPGAYQYTDLNASLQTLLTANSDWVADAIIIGIDSPTGKFTLTLATNYRVDFTIANPL